VNLKGRCGPVGRVSKSPNPLCSIVIVFAVIRSSEALSRSCLKCNCELWSPESN